LFRIVCLTLGATLWTAASHAAEPPLPASIAACAERSDDKQRLACYDSEVQRLQVKVPAVAPEDEFGVRGELLRKRQEETPGPPKLQQLTAKVEKITSRARGELVITLDNGQVWEQAETKSSFLLSPGDQVTVKAGALGSYQMISPTGRTTRVRRQR